MGRPGRGWRLHITSRNFLPKSSNSRFGYLFIFVCPFSPESFMWGANAVCAWAPRLQNSVNGAPWRWAPCSSQGLSAGRSRGQTCGHWPRGAWHVEVLLKYFMNEWTTVFREWMDGRTDGWPPVPSILSLLQLWARYWPSGWFLKRRVNDSGFKAIVAVAVAPLSYADALSTGRGWARPVLPRTSCVEPSHGRGCVSQTAGCL